MLPKTLRLPRAEFSARGYRTVKTPYFFLKIKRNNFPQNRIGVVIGVSAEKSAVRRNFWRRQAKAFLAGQPCRGLDFILIFSKKIKEIDKKKFKEELGHLNI